MVGDRRSWEIITSQGVLANVNQEFWATPSGGTNRRQCAVRKHFGSFLSERPAAHTDFADLTNPSIRRTERLGKSLWPSNRKHESREGPGAIALCAWKAGGPESVQARTIARENRTITSSRVAAELVRSSQGASRDSFLTGWAGEPHGLDGMIFHFVPLYLPYACASLTLAIRLSPFARG